MPTNGIKPAIIALVVCDNIYHDQGGKAALIGLFNRVVAPSFPYKHGRLAIFVSVTDIRPGTIAKLDIVDAETDEPIVQASGKFPDEIEPTAVVDMNFILRNVVFPKAGTYFIRFFGNDYPLVMRPFQIVVAKQPPQQQPQ